MNSHRLPRKGRRMGPIMGHTMHYRRMIITLQPGYSIPPLRKKRTNSSTHNYKIMTYLTLKLALNFCMVNDINHYNKVPLTRVTLSILT